MTTIEHEGDLLIVKTPTDEDEQIYLEIIKVDGQIKYSLTISNDIGNSQGYVSLDAGHRKAFKLDSYNTGKLPDGMRAPAGGTLRFMREALDYLGSVGVTSLTFDPTDGRREKTYLKMLNRWGYSWFKEGSLYYVQILK
jgi:hypothetical protein